MGVHIRARGLYQAVLIILAESSALYAANSLLFLGLWGAKSHMADVFLVTLAETQVSAFFCSLPNVSHNPGTVV